MTKGDWLHLVDENKKPRTHLLGRLCPLLQQAPECVGLAFDSLGQRLLRSDQALSQQTHLRRKCLRFRLLPSERGQIQAQTKPLFHHKTQPTKSPTP